MKGRRGLITLSYFSMPKKPRNIGAQIRIPLYYGGEFTTITVPTDKITNVVAREDPFAQRTLYYYDVVVRRLLIVDNVEKQLKGIEQHVRSIQNHIIADADAIQRQIAKVPNQQDDITIEVSL